ncbi:DUF192 domain-containing protein [Pseudoduganella sp. GCM10020061]|uniref:DUF192 domain-containing protein n=1 Tax=Pseudoduganella sp. GCM10020061 TaxID=3317345 RepID=UPI003626D3E4
MKTLFATAALLLAATSANAQDASFGRTKLSIGINLINAEVAANDPQRQQGLMHRTSMATNAGMVFVFDDVNSQCMWMKNTLIPLSVAFIDANGRIVNIEDMQPETLESHCSKRPVKYALEMNLGWFAKRNIKPGTVVNGLVTPAAR